MNIVKGALICFLSLVMYTCRCPEKGSRTAIYRFGFHFDTVWLSQFSIAELKKTVHLNDISVIGRSKRKLRTVDVQIGLIRPKEPVTSSTRNVYCEVSNMPFYGNTDSFDNRQIIFRWPKGRIDTMKIQYILNGKTCPTSVFFPSHTKMNSEYSNLELKIYNSIIYFFNP